MRIIDADGHVAENSSLAIEAIKRWPDHVKPSADRRLRLMIEGRYYPEDRGPGAGVRPNTESASRPTSTARRRKACSVMPTAITSTRWCCIRASDCAPSLEDPDFAAGFARLYNSWIADYCASSGGRLPGVAVVPIEHGKLAIDVMTEAKELGVVATLVPPALKTRNLDHPDLDPFYAAAVELAMPARHSRRLRAASTIAGRLPGGGRGVGSPATTRTGTANGRRAPSICEPARTSARRSGKRSAG